jgi:hypothetical protein
MSDDTRFDPRFDPAFQPGYVAPPTQPTRRNPLPAVVPPPPTPLPLVVPTAVEVTGVEPPVVESASPGGINPFVIGLGAVSVVLVLGGLYLTAQARELYSSSAGASGFDYATFQVVIYGAPLMIAVGIATAIGILFLFAARWWHR